MKTPKNWKDFEVIATGGGEKLERWGKVFLLRPDPQAIWSPLFNFKEYKDLHAIYERSAAGGGAWNVIKKFPEEWTVSYEIDKKNLKYLISPMGFKHTGLFPEQASNWERIYELVSARKEAAVLNLFGYTGGATIAAAAAGAVVTHVDASRGMVEVCKRNAKLNGLPFESVRYIVEDCTKFVERELRRGKSYDAIIMDPPSFGRGANGEVWKIDEHLDHLIACCVKLLSKKPLFFLINSYTTGLQPSVMKNLLVRNLTNCAKPIVLDAFEIGLPTNEKIILPAGCSAWAIWE